MEAVLLMLATLAVLCLAARRMVVRWDPPYQGLHEAHGRHRRPAWRERLEDVGLEERDAA